MFINLGSVIIGDYLYRENLSVDCSYDEVFVLLFPSVPLFGFARDNHFQHFP